MSTATPPTPKILSWAAIARPHLSQSTAIVRLKTNGLCLVLYSWIWLMPTYYRYLKSFISFVLLVLPVIGRRDRIEYIFQLAGTSRLCSDRTRWTLMRAFTEHLVFFLLVWNVSEACLALRYPTVAPLPRPRPSAARSPAISPVALTAAQRRLKGTPKVLLGYQYLKISV